MTNRDVLVRRESWPLVKPFAISRGSKTAAEVLVCEITESGVTGRGECVPYARYGETVQAVEAALHDIAGALADGASLADLQAMLPPGAARNAADCALWDLRARQTREPAWRRAGLPRPQPLTTAYTISLGSPETMAIDAAQARDRPLLKLKLDADLPLACVAAVRRSAPEATLIADANEGWSVAQFKQIAPELAAMGVVLVEQPVPTADDRALEDWNSPLLICADESFHVAADIASLAGRYSAVNIKLDKAGGLTEALACLAAAKRANLKVMIGCMVATSLSMAPAALLAAEADFVDLDGPLLLMKDRIGGIEYVSGSIMNAAPAGLWG